MNPMSKYPAGAIVRRIDDLGRIVIGKELRRLLRIREGDPIVMWSEGGKLVMDKHSEVATLAERADNWAQSIAKLTGCVVLVSDRDTIVIEKSPGARAPMGVDMGISDELRKVIESGASNLHHVSNNPGSNPVLYQGSGGNHSSVIVPISTGHEVIGTVVLYREEGAVTDADACAAVSLAAIIGSELNDNEG